MSKIKSIQPIPKTAKKVFSGLIFDVYQWRQKLYDGHSTIFEKLKRPDTVEAVCTIQDKIIILRQKQPKRKTVLSLPSGRMDKEGESARTCIKREILEETGYRVKKLRLWFDHFPVSKIDWTVHVFIANDLELIGTQQLDGGEKIKVEVLSFDDFLMLSENPLFNDNEIGRELFLARLYPQKKAELKKLIWADNI